MPEVLATLKVKVPCYSRSMFSLVRKVSATPGGALAPGHAGARRLRTLAVRPWHSLSPRAHTLLFAMMRVSLSLSLSLSLSVCMCVCVCVCVSVCVCLCVWSRAMPGRVQVQELTMVDISTFPLWVRFLCCRLQCHPCGASPWDAGAHHWWLA